MKSRFNLVAMLIACLATAGMVSVNAYARGDDKQKDDSKHAAWDALKALEGTWAHTQPGPDGKVGEVVFHTTAGGSMIMETMFPGAKHEMVNAYHMDGDTLMMTHYCAQGVQPRMKLVSHENGVLKFEFVDCTNLKPGEGHMGGLELTINGEQLIEKWAYLKDGKVVEETAFEFTKKS
ncbi:hypothetical protein BH09PLA1_BH09PLA1_35950 [soil metagenome]